MRNLDSVKALLPAPEEMMVGPPHLNIAQVK